MLRATIEQREQLEVFFRLFTENFEDILLHPVIDEKTGTERLAICIADREDNYVYMLGLWFLQNDPLYKRFIFKEEPEKILLRKPAGLLRRIAWKIKKFVQLLWI